MTKSFKIAATLTLLGTNPALADLAVSDPPRAQGPSAQKASTGGAAYVPPPPPKAVSDAAAAANSSPQQAAQKAQDACSVIYNAPKLSKKSCTGLSSVATASNNATQLVVKACNNRQQLTSLDNIVAAQQSICQTYSDQASSMIAANATGADAQANGEVASLAATNSAELEECAKNLTTYRNGGEGKKGHINGYQDWFNEFEKARKDVAQQYQSALSPDVTTVTNDCQPVLKQYGTYFASLNKAMISLSMSAATRVQSTYDSEAQYAGAGNQLNTVANANSGISNHGGTMLPDGTGPNSQASRPPSQISGPTGDAVANP